MREAMDHALKQFTPILLSGMVAGVIAFIQAMASSNGYCHAESVTAGNAGALGMAFKAAHTIINFRKLV